MSTMMTMWTCLASSARLKRSSHTVSVVGKQAWIFGGELQPRQPIDNQLDVVQLFSTPASALTVSSPTEAPNPRVGSASTVLNGIIYLYSGRGGVAMGPIEENGSLWSYDPSDTKWKLISPVDSAAPYPPARSYHTMTNDGKNTLYIHAGCPEKGRLSDLWAFDVDAKVWRSLQPAPHPPRGGTSIAHCAGKLYRMNGFDGQKEQGGSLDVYDCGENIWSSITFSADGIRGPVARSVCTLLAVKIKGKDTLITAFGEHDPSSLGHAGAGKMLNDVWAFDVSDENWVKLDINGERPQPRGWFDADVVKGEDGKDAIVIHGGLAEDNSRLGDVWILTFE